MRALVAALLLLAGCGHDAPEVREPPPADPVSEIAPEELFAQGVVLAQRGDLIRAEQYLAASMERGHPEDEVMPVLLRVLVASSRLRVALQYAEPYLARNPGSWPLRYLVASMHLGMGESARARRELERVVEVAPDEAEPHFLLGVVLRDEARDPAAAAREFERYLELAPDGAHAGEAREALRRVDLPGPAPSPTGPAESEGSAAEEEGT